MLPPDDYESQLTLFSTSSSDIFQSNSPHYSLRTTTVENNFMPLPLPLSLFQFPVIFFFYILKGTFQLPLTISVLHQQLQSKYYIIVIFIIFLPFFLNTGIFSIITPPTVLCLFIFSPPENSNFEWCFDLTNRRLLVIFLWNLFFIMISALVTKPHDAKSCKVLCVDFFFWKTFETSPTKHAEMTHLFLPCLCCIFLIFRTDQIILLESVRFTSSN